MDEIRFYRARDPYGFLSNFYPSPIAICGLTWPTVEHFFQAMKFDGTEYMHDIRRAPTAKLAADLGRSRAHPLRADWERVKEGAMFFGVLNKFLQHPDLRENLMDTGNATLIEHTRNDRYWGDGGDGAGKNRLGAILMMVRDQLK